MSDKYSAGEKLISDARHPISQEKGSSSGALSQMFMFFDAYGRYIQYAAFGAGIAGLVIIGRSIRITSKFTNTKIIPPEFYTKNVSLYGRVKHVDSTNSLLNVEHLPILYVQKFKNREKKNDGLLKIQIPGLEFGTEPANLAKLVENIVDKKIKFTLIHYNEPDKVSICLVYFQKFLFMQNFGLWCVTNNIGVMSSSNLIKVLPTHIWSNKQFSIYYNKILKQQTKMEKAKSRINPLSQLKSILTKLFRSSGSK